MKLHAMPLVLAMLTAGTACAADVHLYGKIDTGLSYKKTDTGNGSDKGLSMTSGIMNANRFGLIAEEKLTDATSAGFQLESSFNSDDGAMKTSGTLFDRGSILFVRNDRFGELAAGRMGSFRSGTTKYGAFVTSLLINPFWNGWDCIGQIQYMMPWYGIPMRDNVLAYVSPDANGYRLRLQYAMGDGNANENKPSTDRYSAAALTFNGKQVQWVIMADTLNENSSKAGQHDSFSLTVGGNIKTASATYYGWAQYFDNVDQIRALPGLTNANYPLFRNFDQIQGYTLNLGIKIPLSIGRAFGSAGYMYADYDDKVTKAQQLQFGKALKRYNISLGWNYNLSKSSLFYVGATYYRDEAKFGSFSNPEAYQVSSGIDFSF